MTRESSGPRRPEIQAGLLSADRMLEWRRATGRMGRVQAPEGVILTHQASLFRALAPRYHSVRIPAATKAASPNPATA